ncbi:hypothetical protein CCE02nite_14770 [Cellulosimicrobium cellulans]|uniref:Uncharacterized protein n=1 Tax=Cellulosimicrobium cellulans TaxID=1710 RepID=A0A4Y4E1N3_CELCE|nr:hypothetical protein CCE02nite_14770 [Cellulosimicrobium cellulans]
MRAELGEVRDLRGGPHEGDDVVSALHQGSGQATADLAVTSRDDCAHGPNVSPCGRPRPASVVTVVALSA